MAGNTQHWHDTNQRNTGQLLIVLPAPIINTVVFSPLTVFRLWEDVVYIGEGSWSLADTIQFCHNNNNFPCTCLSFNQAVSISETWFHQWLPHAFTSSLHSYLCHMPSKYILLYKLDAFKHEKYIFMSFHKTWKGSAANVKCNILLKMRNTFGGKWTIEDFAVNLQFLCE